MKLAALIVPLGLAVVPLQGHAADQQSSACWRPGEQASASCVQEMVREVVRKRVAESEVSRMLVAARGAENGEALSRFLVAAAQNYELGAAEQAEYVRTAATIRDDAAKQRALTYLTFYDALEPANLPAFLDAARGIGDDEELAKVLVRVAQTLTLDAESRAAFARAAETVQNPTVRRTVEAAVPEGAAI